MGYLKEFEKQINNRDFNKFLELWEEYCTNDQADSVEILAFLKMVKKSDFANSFGKYVEMALPLWQTIQDIQISYDVLKGLIDVQTTNSPVLAEGAFQMLKAAHGNDPQFNERIRMVGLRGRENFQGSMSHYDLLAHMEVGKFVFHTGGWGCGEIMDFSLVREQVGVEFENVTGLKHFTFANAFKTLEPLKETHFLVKRFANADAFEEEARRDPVAAVKLLLKDLGPRTAAEIKDDMCELVIPEKDWTKWWQGARAKLKKDPIVQTPKNIRDPFYIRESEMTHEEMLQEEIHGKQDQADILISSYNLIRDVPKQKKNQDVYDTVQTKLLELIASPGLTPAQQFQVTIMLEQFLDHKTEGKKIEDLVRETKNIEDIIQDCTIIALRKRILVATQAYREDWKEVFLNLLFQEQNASIRDYLFTELLDESVLLQRMEKLRQNPAESPETVFWYFQKLFANKKEEPIPYSDKDGECRWFDALLVALHKIESDPKQKDLNKKIVQFLSNKHFLAIRYMLEDSTLDWTKEFLLLLSKCSSFEEGDQKTFRSLAQVVHSSIDGGDKPRQKHDLDILVFWTSEKAYQEARNKAIQISSVEMIENADEVKKARELGDLRENAEYKAACEKRRRLQHDLRVISDQLNRARVITPADINLEAVGIGAVVNLKDTHGAVKEYTILGPWDANVDVGILSIQSKFAQAMLGRKVGDVFTFREEEYTLCDLKSFLEK